MKGTADRIEFVGEMGGNNVVDHVAQGVSDKIAISAHTDDVDALVAVVSRRD